MFFSTTIAIMASGLCPTEVRATWAAKATEDAETMIIAARRNRAAFLVVFRNWNTSTLIRHVPGNIQ